MITFSCDAGGLPPGGSFNPQQTDLIKGAEALGNPIGTGWANAPANYDIAAIVGWAIDKANSLDGPKIKAALEKSETK